MGLFDDIKKFEKKHSKNLTQPTLRNSKSENSFGLKPLTSSNSVFSKQKKEKDSRRAFSSSQKNEILYQQNNRCAGEHCNHSPLDPRAIEFDHIKPWADNGRTIIENGRALCPTCHKIETHKTQLKKVDKKRIVKKDPYELPKLKW